MPFKHLILTFVFAAVTYGQHYSRLSGWCEQGNKTILVAGNTSNANTPVQRSFPRCVVNVYLAGTVTPATLFSTASGTALGNPVSADVNGFYAFFITDGNYDLAFSGGTPGGIPVPFTKGSQPSIDPFYESSLAGYVARLKNAKMGDILSVKDYGAVGDGTTDDTAAVQAAIDASYIGTTNPSTHVVTPGVCTYFPTGVYKVTAALSYAHTICVTGDQWRIRYGGANPITALLSIVGDPSNTHSSLLEGSFVQGVILDGGPDGKVTDGFVLQGIVSSQINYMRVTNVTGAGVSCNWCQQTTFERLQVSLDFERFIVTPTNGIIIDNISSANILHQVNIDHVSGDGIWLKYGLNTLINGGTSEGNGGWGVRCDGQDSGPFRQCYSNTFIQFDVEANGHGLNSSTDYANWVGGDYYFGQQSFFNSLIHSDSSSPVGIQFDGNSHFNTVIGGAIGKSSAGPGTSGNRLINVGSFAINLTGTTSLKADPLWSDMGQNSNTVMRNESTGVITPPSNKQQVIETWQKSAGGAMSITQLTYDDNTAGVVYGDQGGAGTVNTVGNVVLWIGGVQFQTAWTGLLTINSVDYTISSCTSSVQCTLTTSAGNQTAVTYFKNPVFAFIGFYSNTAFERPWLVFPVTGMNFMSETAPNVNAVADGIIKQHKWGFGRFCSDPDYTVTICDAVTNTLSIRNGAGQGGTDLIKFRDTSNAPIGSVTFEGKWNSGISGGTIGKALCKKSDSTIGSCSTVVDASGNCTCS